MPIVKISSKGQVTIPAEIRRVLDIRRGDSLLFEVAADGAGRFRILPRRRLTQLAGALPATRPFPGKAAVREETGRSLGDDKRSSGRS